MNELKDKAPEVMAMGAVGPAAPAELLTQDADGNPGAEPPPPRPAAEGPGAQAEALSALSNLGYAPAEAAAAVAKAAGESTGSATPELIRAALRLLAPKD